MRSRRSLIAAFVLAAAVGRVIAACDEEDLAPARAPYTPGARPSGDAGADTSLEPADGGATLETPRDAATTAADAADGRAAGGCGDAAVCDDFEGNAGGSAPAGWRVLVDPPDAGSVAIDETRSFSGTKSVKITFNPQNIGRYAQIHRSLPFLTTNAFFGRMHVWVSYSPSGTAHWELVEGWGYAPGSVTRTVSEQRQYAYGYGADSAGNLTAALNAYYLSSTCDCFQQSRATLPKSQWSCVEWQFDGVNDQMRFWLDDQPVPELTVVDPVIGGHWAAPKFEEIRLGWYGAPSTTVEMWLDDVAIDSQRIGCGG